MVGSGVCNRTFVGMNSAWFYVGRIAKDTDIKYVMVIVVSNFSVSEYNLTVDKFDSRGQIPVLGWRSILLLKIKFIM